MQKTNALIIFAMILFTITTAYADPWVEVGPALMPASEFASLQQMVNGEKISGKISQNIAPDQVDLGMAILPKEEFTILRNMVKGIQNSGLKSYPDKTQTMDLGIVTMDQQDFDSLLRMVRKGLLNCCPDMDANNMAVR